MAAWFWTLVVCLGVVEIGLRLLTTTSDLGTEYLRALPAQMPLLPYRPSARGIAEKLDARSTNPFLARDPRLGWTTIDDDPARDINSQGIHARRDRVFDAAIPEGKTRIVAVGDSLLFGVGVKLDEVWSEILEARRPDLEVINLGVPAYGTDQAFLRWRIDGKRFAADYALLGIWPDNLLRNLNLDRYHITLHEAPAEKPRFRLERDRLDRDGLTLVNSPVRGRDEVIETLSGGRRQSIDEYWIRDDQLVFEPWYHVHTLRVFASFFSRLERKLRTDAIKSGADPIGIELASAIAARFGEEVRATGATPVVVILPDLALLDSFAREDSYPLAPMLEAAGLEVIDLMSVFATEGGAELFAADRAHLSAAGNALFARALDARIPAAQRAARRVSHE